MVCGARLNINLWQAVRRRAEGEWNERGNSLLPVVRLSREEKCTGRLCFVPLKCDMRSLTYKLNVTTGGQFYFNRGDHRQATIHFPPFFLSTLPPPLLRFLLFLPLPSTLSAHTPARLSPILTRSNRDSIGDWPRNPRIDRRSPIRFPTLSLPFVYGLLCGTRGLRKARVINSRCEENEKREFVLVPWFIRADWKKMNTKVDIIIIIR